MDLREKRFSAIDVILFSIVIGAVLGSGMATSNNPEYSFWEGLGITLAAGVMTGLLVSVINRLLRKRQVHNPTNEVTG